MGTKTKKQREELEKLKEEKLKQLRKEFGFGRNLDYDKLLEKRIEEDPDYKFYKIK